MIWLEYLNGETYCIELKSSVEEAKSQVEKMILTKYWLISSVDEDGRYKVMEWSKE